MEGKVINIIVSLRLVTNGDRHVSSPLRERVLNLLDSKEEHGGPQSVADVCEKLNISNTNSRSVLVRLRKKGAIERIAKGVYRAKGDKREYKKR